MAQMRVKDQDLVIEQIKSKVNEQGLEALKNRKDVQRITNQLDARISEVKTLQAQREELTKKITKLKNSMGEVVSEFQKEFTNKDDSYNWSSYFRGISLTLIIIVRVFRHTHLNGICLEKKVNL
jgi:ABC-type phosphate transport system auxiliary subunit